jgi:23S rRNA pseudouridine1911/1915/1917 synthase
MVKIPAEKVYPGEPAPLDRVVRELFELSWGQARGVIETGKVTVDGETCLVSERKIRPGSAILVNPNAPRPNRRTLEPDLIAYVDSQLVVVRKPAGISTVPFEGEEGTTLDELVRRWLSKKDRRPGRAPLGVVHRIDKETSGLLVFTRTWDAKQSLSNQFRRHTTQRAYLAIAHGQMKKRTIATELVDNRGDGLRGSAKPGSNRRQHGKKAVTHVEPIENLPGVQGQSLWRSGRDAAEQEQSATLVRVTLETGRTHQIRIHLSEIGHPLVGERVYIRGFKGNPIPAPRLMLHAAELGFEHPNGKMLHFEEPMPADMQKVLNELRSTTRPA